MLGNNVRNIILIVLLLLLMYFCLQMVSENTIQEGARFNFGKFIKRQAAIVKRKTVNTLNKTPAGRSIIRQANVVGKKLAPLTNKIKSGVRKIKVSSAVNAIKNAAKKVKLPPPPRFPPRPRFNGPGKMLEFMNTLPFYRGVNLAQAAALISVGIIKLTDVSERNINARQAEVQAAANELTNYINSWSDYLDLYNDSSLKPYFSGSYKFVMGNLKTMQEEPFKTNTKDRAQVRDFIRTIKKYGLSLEQAKSVMASYNLKTIKELDTIASKIKLTGLANTSLIAFLDSSTKKFQVPLNPQNGYSDMEYFIKILNYYNITTYANYESFANSFLSAMSINYKELVTMYDINIHYGVVVPNISNFTNYVFSMRGSCETECRENPGKYELTSPFLVQYNKTICKLRAFGITNTDIYIYAMNQIPFMPFSYLPSKEKECYINTFNQYGISKIEQIVNGGNRLHPSFPATSSNLLEINHYKSFGMRPHHNLFDFINKLNEIRITVNTFNLYRTRIMSMFSVRYSNYARFHALLMKIQYFWSTPDDFDEFIRDVNAFNGGTDNRGIAKLEFFVEEISNFGIPTYADYRNFVNFMKANVNINNINLKQFIDLLKRFGITRALDAVNLIVGLKEPMLKLNLNKSKPFSQFLERLMALGVTASNISSINVVDLIASDGTTFNKSLNIRPNLRPRAPVQIPNQVSIQSAVPMNQVKTNAVVESFTGIDFDIQSLLGNLTGTKIEREGNTAMGVLERLKAYGAVSLDNICQDQDGNTLGWEKFSARMEGFGILPSSRAINQIIVTLEIFKRDFGVTLPVFIPALDLAIRFGIRFDNLKQFSADVRTNLTRGSMAGNDFVILITNWLNFDVRHTKTDKHGDYRTLLTAGNQFKWNKTYVASRQTYYTVMQILKAYDITHRNHLNDTRFVIFVHNMTNILKLDVEKFDKINAILRALRSLDATTLDTPEIRSAAHNMRDVITPMPNMTYKVDKNGKTCLLTNTCDGSEERKLVETMINATREVFSVGVFVPFLLKEEYAMMKSGDINGLLEFFKRKYSSNESGGVYKFITNLSTAFFKKMESDKNNGMYANYEKNLDIFNLVRFFPYATFSVIAGELFSNNEYDDLQNENYFYVNSNTRPDIPSNTLPIVSYQGFTPMDKSASSKANYRADDGYETMLNMSSSLWKPYTKFNV